MDIKDKEEKGRSKGMDVWKSSHASCAPDRKPPFFHIHQKPRRGAGAYTPPESVYALMLLASVDYVLIDYVLIDYVLMSNAHLTCLDVY